MSVCDPNNGGCIDYSMGSYPNTCDSLLSLCDPSASATPPGDWINYLDCTNNQVPREMFDDWYQSQINIYGAPIEYSVSNFDKTANRFKIRGRDHVTPFDEPKNIKAYINPLDLNINTMPGGYLDTTTFTMMMNKTQYQEIFGIDAQPKSGDIFTIPCFSPKLFISITSFALII